MRTVLPMDPTPVTPEDLDSLHTLFSGIDGHPREDVDLEAWELVAGMAGWTRAEVAAAARTIAATFSGFRILPGHVTTQIVADRARVRQAWYCPDPPRELRNDPAAEVAWRRRAQRDYAERALLAIATGGQLEEVPLLREVEPYRVSALPAAEGVRRVKQITARVGEQKAITARREPRPLTATGQTRWGDLGDEERRAVRAELDARAAAAAGEETRRAVREGLAEGEVAV